MTEPTPVHKKSQGKIIQFDYDWITSLEGECRYCLTDAQVEIILTVLDFVGWSTRWYSDTNQEIDTDQILAIQASLGRALMSGCCDDKIIGTRFNPVTGAMEITTDGINWTPAEDAGEDPRYTSPELPPLPDEGSSDNKCRSSTNASNAMKDAVDNFGTQLGSVSTVIALASAIVLAIVGVFAVPPSATVLIPIVIALAQAIFNLSEGVYLGLFGTDVYNDLQCIMYCHCGDDGTFTNENYLDILTDIDSHGFDSNVALTFTSVLRGWQVPGLNAAARGGSLDTGDCTDCDCGTCDIENWETVYGIETDRNDFSIFVTALQPPGDPNRHAQIGNGGGTGCYVRVSSTPIVAAINWWAEGNYPPAAPDNTTDTNYGKTHRVSFVDAVYGGGGDVHMNFDLYGDPIP